MTRTHPNHEALHQSLVATRRARQQGLLPIMVFDLDSTLYDNSGRHRAIFRAFVLEHGDEHPSIADFGDRVGELAQAWHIVDRLRELGVRDEAGLARLDRYWADRFFSDDWIQHDAPMPGAVAYVRAVHALGAFIYYMTGRHVGGMHSTTVDNLVRDGFPIFDGGAALHMKPAFRMRDKEFKSQAVEHVRALVGEVVATFENEPGNSNLFLVSFPTALHVLIDSVHSPAAEAPHPDLYRIHDFAPGTDWGGST
jgi:hypothetical protein